MMNERDTVNFLKIAERLGVNVWIDGGWGVDALVGHETRPHNDIDIFIEKKDAAIFTSMLISNGYRETEMEYTTGDHTVWCDSCGHIIDLHLFKFGESGTLYFDNEAYPSDILNGKGLIGGVMVRCLSAEAQLLYHQGYAHDENDMHDVLLLCKILEAPVPAEYAEYKELYNDKTTRQA